MTPSPSQDPDVELSECFWQLVAACPDYLPVFHETRTRFYHGDPPDEIYPYSDLVGFTVHLVERVHQQQTGCFPAVFELVERLLVDGSDDVQNWVVVGMLEGLQNQLSHTDLGYAIFEPWLGPQTRKEWDGLINAWGG